MQSRGKNYSCHVEHVPSLNFFLQISIFELGEAQLIGSAHLSTLASENPVDTIVQSGGREELRAAREIKTRIWELWLGL